MPRIGCQTFTWEMLGSDWQGTADDILDAVAAAGYEGVEFSNTMIGPYGDRPEVFAQALQQRGLALAAFAYATTGFTDPACQAADLAGAERALKLTAHFGVPLCLGGPSSASRDSYDAKLATAVEFYREVARRADSYGVTVALHPHSHHTSLVLSPPEYDRLLSAVPELRFNPDTGHLLRGGHDVLTTMRKYQDRIVHVHLKDVDAQGHWQQSGRGICDIPALLAWLGDIGYHGWLVTEEESDAAWKNQAQAIAEDRQYLRSLGCG